MKHSNTDSKFLNKYDLQTNKVWSDTYQFELKLYSDIYLKSENYEFPPYTNYNFIILPYLILRKNL